MHKIKASYLLAALPFISTEETRHYLNGVFIEPLPEGEGVAVVATDGHTLFAARDADGVAPGPAIFPVSPHLSAACRAKRERSTIGYGERFVFFENNQWQVAYWNKGEDGTENFTPTAIGFAKPIDGTFLEWRRVITFKNSDPSTVAPFHPTKLVQMNVAAKALGCVAVIFKQHGDAPSLVTFSGVDDAFALIMSKHGDTDRDKTAWAVASG